MSTCPRTCSTHYLQWILLVVAAALFFCTSPTVAQIYNGDMLIDNPTRVQILTRDVLPGYFPAVAAPSNTAATITAPPPAVITIYINGSIPTNGTLINITAAPAATATTPSYVLPPVPVQPFTTPGVGAFPTAQQSPLPLPTSPAWFPQNISSCTMCYGQFPTLSRCNAVANSGVFPVTNSTTYAELMPFLKCICTYKAIDMYPYCIDCFSKTQQLNQLNVLQAYHLESYQDAFHQLCGATFNGNKIPGSAASMPMAQRHPSLLQLVLVILINLAIF